MTRTPASAHSILVGTDGSDGAELAVTHAVTIGAALGWRVVVAAVHSSEARGIRGTGTPLGMEEARAVLGDTISRHGPASEQAAGARGSRPATPMQGVSLAGPVAKSLVDLARDEDCSLVVVGNRRDAARAAGGMAATLADEAPCDVLVVDTLRGRRPVYRRIGAPVPSFPPGSSLGALATAFSASVEAVPRPARGRWRLPTQPRTKEVRVPATATGGSTGEFRLLAGLPTCQNQCRTTCSSSIVTAGRTPAARSAG